MYKLLLPLLSVALITTSCGSDANKEETTAHTEAAAQPALPAQSKLDEAGTQKLMTVVTDYYSLKDALVATSAAKADEAANKLAASADSLSSYLKTDTAHGNTLKAFADTVSLSSRTLVAEQDETTEKKRIHFEKVSDAMFALLKQAELKNAGVYRQYCPMAFNDKGAYWLSNETEIRNPYFGKKMLECGEVTDSLK